MQVLKAFQADVEEKVTHAAAAQPALKDCCATIQSATSRLLSPDNMDLLSQPLVARDLAFSLARIYMGVCCVSIHSETLRFSRSRTSVRQRGEMRENIWGHTLGLLNALIQ